MSSFDFTNDVKERVRSAIDIVDLVGSYLELRRAGRGFVALCPWHNDTKPSLQVNPERQSWKCWVCDIGGDAFSFVQQREGVGFRQALEMLAERAGIELGPARNRPATKAGDPNDKPTLFRAAAWAEEQFHQFLLTSTSEDAQRARKYVDQRGIDEESVRRHQIGFCPDEWDWLARSGPTAGHSALVLEAAGLLSRNRYDKPIDFFRGRLMFPIRDIQSRPIAFGGRIVPGIGKQDAGKYMNSRETRLYSKSENLYALDLVRNAVTQTKHIVIVEGYTDVVAAFQAGLDNVVACCGTALGERHVRLLRRYADRLTLVLDGDQAGQDRANQVLELFVGEQLDLRVATLPDGMDPADYVAQQGAEPFRELMEQSPDALEHKLRLLTQGLDPLRDTHRANEALEDVLRLLAEAPRLQQETGPMRLRREQVMARLSREFQVSEERLRERLAEIRRAQRNVEDQRRRAAPQTDVKQPISANDKELLEILILDPSLVPLARDTFLVNDVQAGPARIIYQTCLTLEQQGATPDFDRLMTALDDPQLKSLLVELDELASTKDDQTSESAAARLDQLSQRLRTKRSWAENQQKVSELESRHADEKEQIDVLQQCLELQRKRQGIADPTDG